MHQGVTRMIYQPEHVVDLETGAIVAVEFKAGDGPDARTGVKLRFRIRCGTGRREARALSTGPTPTTFTYNLDQQLATVTRPDGVVLSLGYDAASRPASLTTPQGNLTFGYSTTSGHLTSLASPGGVSQSFTYDGALPKTASWSGPVSGSVQLTHDTDFRVTGLTVNSATNIAFGYDTDGLLASAGALSLARDAGNGLLTGTTLGSLTTSWAYDSLALTTSSTALYSATSLFQTSYARDSLGRITTLTETIQGTTSTYAYTYDSSGRLSEVRLGGAEPVNDFETPGGLSLLSNVLG